MPIYEHKEIWQFDLYLLAPGIEPDRNTLDFTMQKGRSLNNTLRNDWVICGLNPASLGDMDATSLEDIDWYDALGGEDWQYIEPLFDIFWKEGQKALKHSRRNERSPWGAVEFIVNILVKVEYDVDEFESDVAVEFLRQIWISDIPEGEPNVR